MLNPVFPFFLILLPLTTKEVVKKPKPEKKNKSDTKWGEVEWSSEAKTEEGNKWTLKLSSWNVDGKKSWPIRDQC